MNLTELVIAYKRTHDKQYLEKILFLATEFVERRLRHLFIPQIIKDEIKREAVSITLLRSIKQYKPNKNASFSTFFFNKIRGLIYDSFAYYHAKKRRIKKYHLTIDEMEHYHPKYEPLDFLIDHFLTDEIIYDDLISEMNKHLSKKAKIFLKLINEGYTKFAAFQKMGYEPWKEKAEKNKIIKEIKSVYRKVNG